MRLELNADVGEGFPFDDDLMTVITAANVACGFHAGDDVTMRKMCALAAAGSVSVGAQFSYRDREGFGRRDVEIEPSALTADLLEQVETLRAAAVAEGVEVTYVKPHGALYNRAVRDDTHAAAVVAAAQAFSLPVLCLPGSRLLVLAAAAGLGVRREFFADRSYDAKGRLVPRQQVGSVLTDPDVVTRRVRMLVDEGVVVSASGVRLTVEVDSVCVHGDSPGALELARAVRGVLDPDPAR